jgi:hypothetical protein
MQSFIPRSETMDAAFAAVADDRDIPAHASAGCRNSATPFSGSTALRTPAAADSSSAGHGGTCSGCSSAVGNPVLRTIRSMNRSDTAPDQ